jgi:signal transduction histidine kinase
LRRLSGAVRALPALVQDGLLAALLCAADLLMWSNLGLQSGIPPTYSTPVLISYAAAGYLALLWRRRAPVLVFAVLWVHAMIAAHPLQYQPILGLVAAVYTLADRRPGTRAWVVVPLAVLPSAIDGWVQLSGLPPHDHLIAFLAVAVYYVLVNGGAWGVGQWARASRERATHLEYRREVEAREAVAREQTRIARELHDIVAHSVTVMVLQAAGGERVVTRDPELAAEALASIRAQGRQAMHELRRMLVLLRSADEPVTVPERQPGVADIAELVGTLRRTGLDVRLDESGSARPVTASAGLAAYRVVQEALTNVGKHAGAGATATVRIHWAGELAVEVRNGGSELPPAGGTPVASGHGLVGLRERVALAGGRFVAGPLPVGGFQVSARLPFAEQEPGTAEPAGLTGAGATGAAGVIGQVESVTAAEGPGDASGSGELVGVGAELVREG